MGDPRTNKVSKALGISAVTVSKAVTLGKRLPEVDRIHKQMVNN